MGSICVGSKLGCKPKAPLNLTFLSNGCVFGRVDCLAGGRASGRRPCRTPDRRRCTAAQGLFHKHLLLSASRARITRAGDPWPRAGHPPQRGTRATRLACASGAETVRLAVSMTGEKPAKKFCRVQQGNRKAGTMNENVPSPQPSPPPTKRKWQDIPPEERGRLHSAFQEMLRKILGPPSTTTPGFAPVKPPDGQDN